MKTRFLILTAILFSLFLGINNTAYADACTVSNVVAGTVTKNPVDPGNPSAGCVISIPVSYTTAINNGNKRFILYVYNGTAPVATNTPPACNGTVPAGTTFLGALNFEFDPASGGLRAINVNGTGCTVPGYALSLTGNATVPVSGDLHNVTATLTITGPGACNTYGSINANIYASQASNPGPGTSNWHCGGSFFTPGSLPVTFESITAGKKNGQLVINWRTATENNCKEYVVEGSRDNVNWTVIGKLDSKAVNGTSNEPLDYSLVLSLPVAAAALGLGGLFFLTLVRSRWARALALVVIVVAAGACLKDGKSVDVEKGDVGYIRIAQYDKDSNTPSYSKVIKVVND